jgi:hypothetical protein
MKTKIAILLALSVMLSPTLARACSVCFGGDDDAVTHAFNWSVGFLLAAPYAIAGTIAACLVIAYRRAAAQRAALDDQEATSQLIWTEEESAK